MSLPAWASMASKLIRRTKLSINTGIIVRAAAVAITIRRGAEVDLASFGGPVGVAYRVGQSSIAQACKMAMYS